MTAEPEALQETRIERAVARGFARVTAGPIAPYQTAVIRIGFAATWLFFLLREWPNRHELYGPDGPWNLEMAHQLLDLNGSFSILLWSGGNVWFEAVYALAVVSSVLLMIGWRTRTMSVLFMVGVLSLQNRSVFLGDGGDNVIHLMSMYLVLTRCGRVWSLDARRARKQEEQGGTGAADPDLSGVLLWTGLGLALMIAQLLGLYGLQWTANGPFPHIGWSVVLWSLWLAHGLWWWACRYAPGEPRTVLNTLADLAHNGALLVIVVEVCLIYATAGWYKIQGSRWQDGTAVFYPLNLDYFSPWPALSSLVGGSALLIMLITYGTVIVQVAFPFTLFNRRLKNALLVAMICEHLSIAVLLGLPFFSLAMVAADAVFLPTNFLRWLGTRAAALRDLLLPGRSPRPAGGAPAAPEGTPGAEVPGARTPEAGGGHTLVG